MKSKLTEIIALGIVLMAIVASNTTSIAYANKDSEAYPIYPAVYPKSIGGYDGYVIESTELSGKGGTRNITSTTFIIGDNALDRQIRGILHFNTGAVLPDGAIVRSATLKIKRQGLVGNDPFSSHGNLLVDIVTPHFGLETGLVISDFQAPAKQNAVAVFSKYPFQNWYSAPFRSGLSYISRTGTTQLRLRFSKDDDDDNRTDYLSFHSGNSTYSSFWPVLRIEYYVP